MFQKINVKMVNNFVIINNASHLWTMTSVPAQCYRKEMFIVIKPASTSNNMTYTK